MTDKPQKLRIANRDFNSRLIMGTGKFASGEIMAAALEASGAEMVTVALRRADLSGQRDKFANILTFVDAKRYLLLPNTSGARCSGMKAMAATIASMARIAKRVRCGNPHMRIRNRSGISRSRRRRSTAGENLRVVEHD